MPNNMSGYPDGHSISDSYKPGNNTVKENLECTEVNGRELMIENCLKMNYSKTEFLVFGIIK